VTGDNKKQNIAIERERGDGFCYCCKPCREVSR